MLFQERVLRKVCSFTLFSHKVIVVNFILANFLAVIFGISGTRKSFFALV